MAAVPNLLGRTDYTREEVTRLEEAGLLTDRVELIDGELVSKMGQNPPHALCLQWLHEWLLRVFGTGRVRTQVPIEVAEPDRKRNAPQPDIAVVRQFKPEYWKRHPRGDELILVVEISDASLRFDLSTKLQLYARAGVPEYWVLDIGNRRLIMHRSLDNGIYSELVELTERETLTFHDAQIPIADLLPQ
jgi:Uma2 family endonuclease